MRQTLQLPAINALQGSDRDVLRQIFTQLVAEVNELNRQIALLSAQSSKSGGY